MLLKPEDNNTKHVDLELVIKGIKGILRDIILYTIYRLGETHGYAIKNYINRLLGIYTPSSGVLYPTLRELERKGLITSTWRDRRRVYMLTKIGHDYITSRLEQINNVICKVEKAVNIMINIGLLDLLKVIRECWERNIEIPQEVLEFIKTRVKEIIEILNNVVLEIEKK